MTALRRVLPHLILTVTFLAALTARLLAHDLVITADEDNWMRRAGGFTWGLMNDQAGRTYQNGHPGVTTMWVAMLTLGPERMVQYADRVHNLRLVGRVPGFWEALVDARIGFALVTALLVTLIAGLAWRIFGALVGTLTGLLVGLEPFFLAISQLVHMDAILSGCMVAAVLSALVRWTRGGGRSWLVGSGLLTALAILSKVPAVYLLAFVPMLGLGLTAISGFRRHPERSEGSFSDSGRDKDPSLRSQARSTQDDSQTRQSRPAQIDSQNSQTRQSRPAQIDSQSSQGRRASSRQDDSQGTKVRSAQDDRRRNVLALSIPLAVDLLVWGVTVVVVFVAFWPTIWVHGPVEIIGRVIEFTRETGGQPHEQGTFFWGSQTADPGPLFYPVAMAFRLAPLTVVGLALAIVLWRRIAPTHRIPALVLLAYGLGFLLMMTLGAKKLDRYVLPIFPALGILAALGLAAGLHWYQDRMTATPTVRVPWRGTAAALLVMLAVWPAASTYPYYLSYYSPLLGGGPAAQRTVMVGNGEGLDQVAAWLNARPNAANLSVISHSFDILQALLVSSGESLRDRVPPDADYVVLYRFQIQIGHSPRVLDEYLNQHTPEHVVTINGVEYARIYRGPHLLAAEAGDGGGS